MVKRDSGLKRISEKVETKVPSKKWSLTFRLKEFHIVSGSPETFFCFLKLLNLRETRNIINYFAHSL